MVRGPSMVLTVETSHQGGPPTTPLGLRVKGSGFKVYGLGFKVSSKV